MVFTQWISQNFNDVYYNLQGIAYCGKFDSVCLLLNAEAKASQKAQLVHLYNSREGDDASVAEQGQEAEKTVRLSFGGKVISLVRTVLVYALAAGLILAAILFAADKSPQKSIFGYRYYTVLTPSMEPEYSVGDIVIVKVCSTDEANELQVGDVITFNPSSESTAYLTHRITQKLEDYEGTGVTCFKTQGDANESEDSFLLDSSRVVGKVTFSIPKLGYIIRFVQLRWYFVVPLAILLIILLHLVKKYFEVGAQEKQEAEDPEKTDFPAVSNEATE